MAALPRNPIVVRNPALPKFRCHSTPVTDRAQMITTANEHCMLL